MKKRASKLLTLVLVALVCLPVGALRAQEQPKSRPRTVGQTQTQTATPADSKPKEHLEPNDQSAPPRSDVPAQTLANRQESMSDEEAQIVPYYNNYLSSYRLGPEDVISVDVLDLPKYSKTGITVPPHGVITLPLIPEGVFVVGKTTTQVAEEITKKLDEYVIDPKVTVSLDKAQSAIFAVMGNVMQPGIRPMTRRLSVSEAVALAGGPGPTANLSKVFVARRTPEGILQPIPVNLAAIAKGRAPDNFYLNPGDQVFVPNDKWKSFWQKVPTLIPLVGFARIFTGGF